MITGKLIPETIAVLIVSSMSGLAVQQPGHSPVPRNGVTVLADVTTDDVEGEKEREAAALLLQQKGFEP